MTFTPDSEIRTGDWVRSRAGDKGQVMGINGRTAYIKFGATDRLEPYLVSRLIKVDRPADWLDQIEHSTDT